MIFIISFDVLIKDISKQRNQSLDSQNDHGPLCFYQCCKIPQFKFNFVLSRLTWIFGGILVRNYGYRCKWRHDLLVVDRFYCSQKAKFSEVSIDCRYEYSHEVDRMWRKTRSATNGACRGVDPNRNWGHRWGGEGASTSPCAETYRGPRPFSEPETSAIRDFILARKDQIQVTKF